MYRIPVFNKEGAFDGIIGSVVDVSHFKDFRQSFASTIQVPTVVVDQDNIIREFNLQYAAMLKTDPDYLTGQPFVPLPGAVLENANVASTTSTKEVELDGVKYIRYSARTQNGLTAHMYFVVEA
jgi:nitrogenase subunit NifH